MFRATREQRRPSLSQEAHESGADSDDSEAPDKETTNYPRTQGPLTKTDLHQMLLAASADIKAHTAAELERHISGLKGEIETLNNRTSQAKADITQIKANTTQHSQDIFYLSDKETKSTFYTTRLKWKNLQRPWGYSLPLGFQQGTDATTTNPERPTPTTTNKYPDNKLRKDPTNNWDCHPGAYDLKPALVAAGLSLSDQRKLQRKTKQ
ncbi:Hypothetical predicted protein [Pelobates cultripes]|uniref:Uncharacterized protein n=1 Tax=Pelobates cultripes TaxID=61616 RepID=A0AAD1RM61_PELCU|nr:Hypothetical predicted protein [Pelobates cultripes]